MVRGVVLPYTRGGLISAVLLGGGRAVGEAIAVTQVIGTTAHLTANLFDTGDTLASRIAAQYQAAASNLQVASLFYLGVILLVISLIVNFLALLIVAPLRHRAKGLSGSVERHSHDFSEVDWSIAAGVGEPIRSRRACRVLAAFVAIGVLALVVISVFVRGVKALNIDFFTQSQVTFGETGGGIANGLVGSAIIVAIATAIALPVGILVAVYVAEFGGSQRLAPDQARARRAQRRALDRRRHLRLRTAGGWVWIRSLEGVRGARDHHAAARGAIHDRGAWTRARRASLRQLRARRQQVAHRALRRDAVGDRLDHDRSDAGHRPGGRRDGAAPVHDFDLPPEPGRDGSQSRDGCCPAARSCSTPSRRTRASTTKHGPQRSS